MSDSDDQETIPKSPSNQISPDFRGDSEDTNESGELERTNSDGKSDNGSEIPQSPDASISLDHSESMNDESTLSHSPHSPSSSVASKENNDVAKDNDKEAEEAAEAPRTEMVVDADGADGDGDHAVGADVKEGDDVGSGNDEHEGVNSERSNKAGTSKSRRLVLSSDEEDDVDKTFKTKDGSDSDDEEEAEVGVGELMTNIFGEDSDEEKDDESERQDKEQNDNEPKLVNGEEEDDRVWDFDVMLRSKKAERRRPRRRRRDGSIYVGGMYDDQIKELIEAMKVAAKEDRRSNIKRTPALQKRKMLPAVKALLIKHDLMEAIIDNGMMNAISEWLAPLPDKSLPALEIRTDLLKILRDYNKLEPGTLKQSGLGRAVMLLYKHPRETKENKTQAAKLISDWARPIFQLDTDYRSMTKDERVQRDYAQLPEAKRRRLNDQSDTVEPEREAELRPGDRGFVMRARVPRPSQKDYVVRPKSNVEGQFRGATKSRSNSRFDRAQREFKERTKQMRVERAVAVSINRVSL